MEQREIKFRAWEPTMGEMIYPFAGSYNSETNVSIPSLTIAPDATDPENYTWMIYWDGATDIRDVRLHEGLKLMQFTGLKDKSGKDIYEGDKVVVLSGESAIVVFRNCAFLLEWIGLDTYADLLGWIDFKKCAEYGGVSFEVIGNIYEHPHLLTKSPT